MARHVPTMMTLFRRFPWLWLIPVLLLLTLLAARMLNADVLFVDEYWSIRNSGGAFYGPLSPAGIWQTMSEVDPGGMGVWYHWLLAGWFALVGTSEFTLRVFSLLAGVLCIAWMVRMGRDMFDAKVGLYAAVLLGFGAFYVDYMHEGRAYTLLALFASITLWTYWRIMTAEREPGFGWYALLTAGIAALAYTHYIALAVGAAIGVYHLGLIVVQQFSHSAVQSKKPDAEIQTTREMQGMARHAPTVDDLPVVTRHFWSRWIKVMIALALGGLLFLPWLGITLTIIQRGAGETTRQETAMNARVVVEMLIHTFASANGALLALLLVYAMRVWNRHSALIWCWLLVILALILVVNAFIPFMVHPRYMLVLFPALALLAGLGVARLAKAGVPALLLLTIWAGTGMYFTLNPNFINDIFGQIYRSPKAGVDQALNILKERSADDDLVIFQIAQPGFEPFQFFVLDYLMHGIPGRYDQLQKLNNSFAKSDNAYLEDTLAAFQEAPFIWTLMVPDVEMTNLGAVAGYALDGFYANCGTSVNRPDMVMTLYARQPDRAPDATFAAEEALGLFLLKPPAQNGDGLDVTLGWSAGTIPALYSVGLHVYDANGEFVTQADAGLTERRPFGCQTLHIVLDNLPAGEYTLNALVYNWQTQERLPANNADGSAAGDKVAISTINHAE